MNNPLKNLESVEVFSDMTFYIVDTLDGKLCWQTLYTNALYSLVDTLKSINDMHKDATLIACCYRQYEGSYNVEVDPVKQYERIYEYADNNYKTFSKKAIEANLPDTIVLLNKEDVLKKKLQEAETHLEKLWVMVENFEDDETMRPLIHKDIAMTKMYINDIKKELEKIKIV